MKRLNWMDLDLDLTALLTCVLYFIKTTKRGSIRYDDHPQNHIWTFNPRRHIEKDFAFWCISTNLYQVNTNVSLPSGYVKHFVSEKLENKDFIKRLQIKDVLKIEKSKI